MSIELPVGIKRALERLAYGSAGQVFERLLNDAQTAVWEPADEEAMLGLSQAKTGDVAVRGDGPSFVLKAEPPSELANWVELSAGGGGGGGGIDISVDTAGQGSFTQLDLDSESMNFTDLGEGIGRVAAKRGFPQSLLEDELAVTATITATPSEVASVNIPAPLRDMIDLYRVDWRWTDNVLNGTAPAGNTVANVSFLMTGTTFPDDAVSTSHHKGKEIAAAYGPTTESQGCMGYHYYEATAAVTLRLYMTLTPTNLDSGDWQVPVAGGVSSLRFSVIKVGSYPAP